MDAKRKANGSTAAGEELDDRAAKRRKVPDIDLSAGETPETTLKYGLPFIEQLKKTTDKSGRLVATDFLTLPSRKEFPDYYDVIKMPIALDTIEDKLKGREFPTLTSLESYCKRMIANAKEYNEKGSDIYDDAERIRKALSNFMTKTNPAYKTPGYQAFPTPIPPELLRQDKVKLVQRTRSIEEAAEEEEEADGSDEDAPGEPDPEATPAPIKRARGRPPKNPPLTLKLGGQRSSAPPTSLTDSQYANVAFQGLTFQQAQEKIVADLILQKEDEDDEFSAFEVFVSLPPRSLKDYYQVIPHPVSLKTLQKGVRGFRPGRTGNTGVSDFKSWQEFEEEAEHIWNNAWHYNEDGSEISNLAKDLQVAFNKKLAQAKKYVQEPTQPKLKLKMSAAPEPAPKITFRLGEKPSPAESPAPAASTPGDSGPDPNGAGARRASHGSPQRKPSIAPGVEQPVQPVSNANTPGTPSTSAPVKNEEAPKNSPAPLSTMPLVNGLASSMLARQASYPTNGVAMPPPAAITPGMTPSSGYSSGYMGYQQPAAPQPQSHFESKWRPAGKTAADAMITNLKIGTHPGLNIPQHFKMALPPSDTMAQQSITISLPSTHYYLQIRPQIAKTLMTRQHKLFVTIGTQRLHAMPTIPGHPIDPLYPLFEARLLPGVNRIEIELIAALPRGAPRGPGGSDVELEKITVFAHLLR